MKALKMNWKDKLIFAFTLLAIITFYQTKLLSQTQEECGFREAINSFWQQKQPVPRPVLQNEQIIATSHFLIHYSLTDPDHATTVEWAQAISTYAEESWSVIENLGWELPPPDNGNGGDDRYDIYIVHTPGYNGITRWEDPYPTPYPNGYSSWIEVRNDSFNDPYVGEFERLRVLIAHEFHHACQLRYVLLQSRDAWFYENTSVLMEKLIYPQINYLQYRLAGSNSPLLVPQWSIDHQLDEYPYPGGLWALFINEYYEDDTAVRKVWETEGNNPSMEILSAMNQSFQQYYNSDLAEALKKYAIWRYFTGNRADGDHFSDAAIWPTSTVLAVHNLYPVPLTQVLNKVDGPGGAVYVQFFNGENSFLDLTFDGEDGWIWSAFSIEYYPSQSSISQEFALDVNGYGETSVPWVDQEHIAMVPILIDWENPIIRRDFEYSANLSTMYPVQFMNRIGASNAGDSLILDGTKIIPSGRWEYFPEDLPHSVETATERFVLSSVFKHHDWNDYPGDYLLRKNFYPSEGDQYANFIPLSPAVIRTRLLSAGGDSSGTIEFHDPWFLESDGSQLDSFLTFNSPYHPTGARDETEGGVFLDQEIAPNKPHYSVRVPSTQTIPFHNRPILWYFQHWEGEDVQFQHPDQNETAVVFQAANAEARAVYKGHLVSDRSRATAPNNARRIAKDDQGRLHVVYEDGGKIWYTYSTDEGNTWAPEVQLNEDYVDIINRYPAMAVAGNTLHVVWTFQVDNVNPYIIDVRHASLNLSTGEWSSPQFITASIPNVTKIPAPAIAVLREGNTPSYRVVMVVEVHEVGLTPQIYTYHYANSSWNWVMNQYPNGINPTLASDNSDNGIPQTNFLYLAYERNGELYGRLWNNTDHEWGGEVHLTENAPPGIHQHPSLSLYRFFAKSYGALVWEVWNDAVPLGTSFRSIAYRTFDCEASSIGEQEVTLFTGNNPQYPGISTWGATGHDNAQVSIFYEENGQIAKQVYDGNYWSGQFIGDGRSPNVIAQGHSGLSFYSAGMVYSRDDAPPHRLAFDYLEPVMRTPGGQMVLDSLITYKRLDYFWPPDSAGVLLSLNIREPQAADQPLQFNWKPVSDEFTVRSAADSFTCQLTGRFYYSQTTADSQQVLFRLQFVESTGVVHPLMEMHLGEWLPYNDGEEHTVPLMVSLASVANLTGRLWLDYPRSLGYVRDVVEWPDSTARKMAQVNPSGQGEGLMATPVEFTLRPNYPNPFNPTTNVEFGLPNAEWVTLKIYDLLGREVKTLVNERLEAGYHTVQWDGTDDAGRPVASGVYLYRLTHTPLNPPSRGENRGVSQTRKMVLMR